jgi:hypothetical protein
VVFYHLVLKHLKHIVLAGSRRSHKFADLILVRGGHVHNLIVDLVRVGEVYLSRVDRLIEDVHGVVVHVNGLMEDVHWLM